MDKRKGILYIIEEAIKTPGFIKGYLLGILSIISGIIILLTSLATFVFKDFSFKDITTYIYETEKNKEMIVQLNNKINNLKERNNSYQSDNNTLKIKIKNFTENSNNINQITALINNFNKKYEDILYNNSSFYSINGRLKYRSAVHEYNAINKQIITYNLQKHFLYFTEKIYNSLNNSDN